MTKRLLKMVLARLEDGLLSRGLRELYEYTYAYAVREGISGELWLTLLPGGRGGHLNVLGRMVHHELARLASIAWTGEEMEWGTGLRPFEGGGQMRGRLGWWFRGDSHDTFLAEDVLSVIDEEAIPWFEKHTSLQDVILADLKNRGPSKLVPIGLAMLGHRSSALKYLSLFGAIEEINEHGVLLAARFVRRYVASGPPVPLKEGVAEGLEVAHRWSPAVHGAFQSKVRPERAMGSGLTIHPESIREGVKAAASDRQTGGTWSDRESMAEARGLEELAACFPDPGSGFRMLVSGISLAELAAGTEEGERMRSAVDAFLQHAPTEEEARGLLREYGLLQVLQEYRVSALAWLRAVEVELGDE